MPIELVEKRVSPLLAQRIPSELHSISLSLSVSRMLTLIHLRSRSLLLNLFLGLLALRLQEAAQPPKPITRHHQARRDHRLPAGNIPVAATLLVLAAVGLEDVVSRLPH